MNRRKIRSIEKFHGEVKNSDFYQFCVTNRSRNILNQNSKLVIELEFRKMIFGSEKDASHSLQTKFLKFRQYIYKKAETYIIKDLEKEEILVKFYEKERRKSSD